uniref:Uncharacterized protein n=1 Tax=Romanomermis culicivorax TaxID=13658 RepID=A0A915KPB4_ROMCU
MGIGKLKQFLLSKFDEGISLKQKLDAEMISRLMHKNGQFSKDELQASGHKKQVPVVKTKEHTMIMLKQTILPECINCPKVSVNIFHTEQSKKASPHISCMKFRTQ